jgi:glutamate dehydrogenase
VSALEASRGIDSANVIVDSWRAKREDALERYARLLTELRAAGGASLSMLLVVVREMTVLERA